MGGSGATTDALIELRHTLSKLRQPGVMLSLAEARYSVVQSADQAKSLK
jgi:hypothetical protein